MIIDKKCSCGNNSTGNTTIRCCNLCGLPLPTEPWHFNLPENIFSPVEPDVSQENGGQWICAKEKLPEKNRVVITFDNKEERDIDKYGCDFIYADPNGKLHWDWHFDDNDFYWKDFSRFSG